MNFTIEKESIIKSLKSAASIAGRKTTQPILSFIRLSAEGSKLTLCATDLEMGFQARYAADVPEAGEICLPAKVLYDIVAALPDGPIEFTADSRPPAMTLRAPSGVYKIPGLKADEFPSMGDLANIGLISVQASDLRNLIHKILYAVSTDESRANLTGGFLKQEGNVLLMVATDGHRMAKSTLNMALPEAPGDLGKEKMGTGKARGAKGGAGATGKLAAGMIIPRTALQELLHILDKRLDKMVMIGCDQSHFILRVSGEDLTFHVQLIEAEFPNYNRVLPKELTIPVVIRRAALTESLQRVNVLAGGGYDTLTVQLAGNKLELILDNPNVGTAEEAHEIRNITQVECATRMDIHYLRSALEVTHEDEIVIDLSEGEKPIQVMNLSAIEDEEKDYIGLVMPLKN